MNLIETRIKQLFKTKELFCEAQNLSYKDFASTPASDTGNPFVKNLLVSAQTRLDRGDSFRDVMSLLFDAALTVTDQLKEPQPVKPLYTVSEYSVLIGLGALPTTAASRLSKRAAMIYPTWHCNDRGIKVYPAEILQQVFTFVQ